MLIIAFHKVTFETLNGSVIDEVTLTGAPAAVEEQNVAHNSLLDNTNDKLFLTSQSHVFKYWSETEGGSEFDVKTQPILKDMKLYAVWEAKVFRVSFVTGTPDITVPDQHVKWGKEVVDPRTQGTEMVRDGFVFRFFSLAANGSSGEYQFSNKVYLETEIFAVWEEKTRMFGEHSNAFVMKGQKLYAAGENGNGQLGLGHKDVVKKFTLVPKERYFNKNIKRIAPAKFSTLMLTSDNELYAVGANDKGQLGLGYSGEDILNWTHIPKSSYNSEMIKEIFAIAVKTFAFVTENNKIYTWGSNEAGLIGTGDDNYDNIYNKPTQISPSLFDNKQIKKIIISVGHGGIITADDSLYLWGYNDSYEFIIKDKLYYNKPTLIPSSNYHNKVIKDVVLSSSHVFYIMQDGTIYVAGFNTDGRMGIGNEASLLVNKRILTLLDYLQYTNNKRIVKIHSKMAGAYFYTEDGKVYYAGSHSGGGQGHSNMIGYNWNIPTLVNVNVEGVSNTIVDTRIIFFSSFVLTSDGTVLAAGNNEYGKLGIDSEEQRTLFFHKCIFQD